ncbi:Hypersensitive-induced response protein 4 [Capsicum chinense]|nr:Hypersensitive-induced response protein 4 [Capsicum chinense]
MYGFPLNKDIPTTLYEDNVACIAQLKGGYIKGDRTKHISPKKNFTHDLEKKGEIDVQQIRSRDNLADMFNKALPTSTFEKLRYKIGFIPPSFLAKIFNEAANKPYYKTLLVIRENADDAFYELDNPEEQIQSYVFDVVRAHVPKMNLDELFEQKDEVAKAVLEELDKRQKSRESPPLSNRNLSSFKCIKGEAEKILQVKKAEAEAESKYLGGVGIPRQRQAITDGLRENILNFSHKVEGTSAIEVMDLIMITQYFDTIKDIGNSSNNTTVFLPHGPGHVRDIGQQICDGMMEAASAHIHTE